MLPLPSPSDPANLLLGILDGSPNGIIAYQPVRGQSGSILDYRTIYYNQQAQKLLGYTDADFTHKTLFERFPDGRSYEAKYIRMVKQNQPFIFESYFKRAQCWLEVQARQLGDGFFLLLRDITDRKQAEAALVKQNQLLDGVINTFLSGITALEVVLDEAGTAIDFRVTLVNDGALQLSGGHSREDLLGKTITALYPETADQGMLKNYLAVYNTNESIRVSHFYPVPQKWIDLSIQRTEVGLLVTYNDITEQKQAEQQLQQSAHMLQNVLDGVQSGIISYKSVRNAAGQIIDFEVLSANQQACHIRRLPIDQMLGQRMMTLFPTKREDGLFDQYTTVVETGQKIQLEHEFKTDGYSTWFDIAAIKQGDGLVLTFLDISERKQAQLDLARQTDRLTAIFESSLNGIVAMQVVRDDEGNPIDFLMEAANESTLTMTGRTPAEIVGTRLLTTFPGNVEAGFYDLYQRVVATGNPERTTQYYQDQNGLEAWFEVSAVRQGTERVVVTFSDVTAAQLIQQQLRESNQSLEQFAGIASHDLQEPLRKVQSFGNILAQQFGPQLGESGLDMIRRMQTAADRMAGLIRDLLAYSRVTSQVHAHVSLNLNNLVADVLTDLETRITEKNAVIDVSVLPTIQANSLTIGQLMQNLIGNALKFSRPGVPPHIQISAERVSGKTLPASLSLAATSTYWAIRIADNGIGFDDKYRDRIFGAFQRLHSRNSPYPGTGIGLAIVKKVVEQHYGAIEAQGKVGEGATFTIYLLA
ncbi:PAS domain-containing protein [Fibrella arboris]|uniref:PAS domain-containing protein n=1 Tax=Fibrella arboris TaxID=3242486 RepID=UPI00352082B7